MALPSAFIPCQPEARFVNYQTLIFDLDGTLTDPLLGVQRCMNHALTSHGYPARPEQEIKRHIGPPLEFALQAHSGSADPAHILELVTTYRERYGELGYRENTVYPGIRPMLERLQAADIRMGVCTSKLQKYAQKVLDAFELSDFFVFIDGPTAVGVSKAEQLEGLLAKGSIQAPSLMIGDRAIDLSSAHRNRLDAAGVLWGYGSREELQDEAPALIIESPQQLVSEILRD